MNGILKYLIPLAFILLAGFNSYNQHWLEAALYVSVGAAFPLMWAIRDKKITRNFKLWNGVAWVLVILAIFLFIAVLLTDTSFGI